MSTIIRKTYSAGALDIATLVTTNGLGSINWLLNDHLGSTAITVRANGTKSAELRYSAFSFALRAAECYAGETRYTSGTTPTDYRYTGQLQQGAVNLYYYNARWYDPKLARFTQADTIVPNPADPQSWDRYAYVKNNPMRYTDPSGNYEFEETPNDTFFVHAHPGITAARRYVSKIKPITQSEADRIFASGMKAPLEGKQNIPHGFGDYREIRDVADQWFGKRQWHPSMDAGRDNGLLIHPIFGGVVIFIGWTGLGNTVIIEHDIHGYKYYSIYGHLGNNPSGEENAQGETGINTFRGDSVGYSSVIGTTGSSKPGIDNMKPHLHFEVRYETNINLANEKNPLYRMRYWAFEGEIWREYFFDLGII